MMSEKRLAAASLQQSRRNTFLAGMMFAIVSLFFIGGLATSLAAADPASAAEQAPSEAEKKSPAPNGHSKDRQVKALTGLVGLVGIVITFGIGMLALISLWGARLRRQLRKPLPECEAGVQDFWFLKGPKPAVRESLPADSHQSEPPPSHDEPPL